MESLKVTSVSETGESTVSPEIAAVDESSHDPLVSLEVTSDVKSTSRVPVAEQPAISLEPTSEVKSAVGVQPVNITQAVAATQAVDAAIAIGVPVAAPKRHRFRPRVRPIRLPAKVHTFDSFHYRNYRFVWMSTLFFSGAFWLQTVIVGWLTFSLTQSALLTSIAMGLDALPILLAGPFGGMLVDSFDRRKLLAINHVYQAVITVSFAAIVLLGALEVWHIFAFIFMMGISWVINDPAKMSLMSNSVPKENLVNAFALNGLAFSATRLAAPALGGIILAVAGPGPTLLIQVTLLIAAALSALSITMPSANRARLRLRSTLKNIVEGASYIRNQPIILGLMLFSTIPAVLVMPFSHGLIPVYSGEVFDVGPATLGLLMSCLGAGSLVGTIVLASFGNGWPKGQVIVISLVITAIAMIMFAFNRSLTSAFPLVMLLSVGVMTFFATTTATIQGLVPDEFRGRVTGLYILTFGMMPIGSLAAGIIAERLGAPNATLIGSAAIFMMLLVLSLRFREVWRLK